METYTLALLFLLVGGDGMVYKRTVEGFTSREACERVGLMKVKASPLEEKLSSGKFETRIYTGHACRENRPK